MKALILAAGMGTRMRPLTLTRSKSLLPVAGKKVIEWQLEALKEAGLKDVYVIINPGTADQFKGLGANTIEQPEPLGTGHAVSMAQQKIKEPFLCLNGDHIIGAALIKKLVSAFQKSGLSIITTRKVDDPKKYGIVETKGSKVLKIVEKPSSPKSDLASIGIYIFTQEIFEKLKKIKKSERNEYEVTDAINTLADEGKVEHIDYDGEWLDIGKPWDLLNANEVLMRNVGRRIDCKPQENAVIKGNVQIGKGTEVLSGAYIMGPAIIGKNCLIGPNCYIRGSTVIGDNVHIGNAVEVKNSIIMNNTKIPHLSYVGDSVVGENCNLAAGTITANLRFDDNHIQMLVKGKPENTGRRKLGAIIGDNVKTGINVSIMPGRSIGPGKIIAPGTVVDKDVY